MSRLREQASRVEAPSGGAKQGSIRQRMPDQRLTQEPTQGLQHRVEAHYGQRWRAVKVRVVLPNSSTHALSCGRGRKIASIMCVHRREFRGEAAANLLFSPH